LSTTGQQLDEKELVALLKARDQSAIATLYDNYSPVLYGVIFRILQNEELSNDVLQEVFVKIWKNIDKYDPSKGRLFTWLLNLARNKALDVVRSADFKKSGKVQNIDNVVYKFQEDSFNTDHIGLEAIVKQLKPEYRVLIDLIYFEGFTHVEAAEKLEIPLGTVKTRVRAALIELRKIM
jgi:RNA polymerase sigma factor (sigma-70 family)